MAEYMKAQITIGGNLPRSLVPALCETIIKENVSLDWGCDVFEPDDEDELQDACDGEHLVLNSDECSWGRFDELEAFCKQHSLAFDRHHSAKYEYDAELVQYRPKLGEVAWVATDEGAPLVYAQEVAEVKALLDKGDLQGVTVALERILPYVTLLPPFKVVEDV